MRRADVWRMDLFVMFGLTRGTVRLRKPIVRHVVHLLRQDRQTRPVDINRIDVVMRWL